MVALFQLFGFSVLFWTLIGSFRFIAENLTVLRRRLSTPSPFNIVMSAFIGTALSLSIFFSFIVVANIKFFDAMPTEESLIALYILLLSVFIGSYAASRTHQHAPVSTGAASGLGAALFVVGYATMDVGSTFAPHVFLLQCIWIFLAALFAIVAAYLGAVVNKNETELTHATRILSEPHRILTSDVAVVIAAHNEELTIGSSIESLLVNIKNTDIYVASDGSTDDTVRVVESFGCNVDNIFPNRGKAGALTHALARFDILSRYKAVLLIDADIKVAHDYFAVALPAFDEPDVVAVSGYFQALWPRHYIPRLEYLVTAYRIRLWRILQFLVRYGQTWKHFNASPIIPGGGSIYRTHVLKRITIDTPGLVIEDFNMTFQVHRFELGRILFEPRALTYDQEPYSVQDFVKQIRRWYLGYFQAIRTHGIWFSSFCFFTYLFTLEMVLSSVLFLLTPVIVFELLATGRTSFYLSFGTFGYNVTLLSIVFAIVLMDYVMTIVVSIIEGRAMMLVYGVLFLPLRYIEAAIFLSSIPLAIFKKYNGSWKSPERRSFDTLRA